MFIEDVSCRIVVVTQKLISIGYWVSFVLKTGFPQGW